MPPRVQHVAESLEESMETEEVKPKNDTGAEIKEEEGSAPAESHASPQRGTYY